MGTPVGREGGRRNRAEGKEGGGGGPGTGRRTNHYQLGRNCQLPRSISEPLALRILEQQKLRSLKLENDRMLEF